MLHDGPLNMESAQDIKLSSDEDISMQAELDVRIDAVGLVSEVHITNNSCGITLDDNGNIYLTADNHIYANGNRID